MRLLFRLFVIPSLLVGAALGVGAAPADLKALQGVVEVQRNRQGDWQRLEQGTVDSGDRVRTGSGASAFLTLPDDHRVMIGPDSSVTLERLDHGQTKLFVKTGAIRNKVRKLNVEQGNFFRVQTPSIVVAVRGTDFSVTPQTVHVFEGHVDLSALRREFAKQVTPLIAGQGARVESSGQIQPLEPHLDSTQGRGDVPHEKPHDASDTDSREPHNGQGPPPPPPTPPTGGGMNWWDHPESAANQPGFFGDDIGKPSPPQGPPKGVPPPPPKPSMPPSLLQPTIPPGGDNNTPGAPAVGLDALISTMRSQNLHDQANAILVADLFQRHAVATDPFTGQIRQYADAILSAAPDAIRFVNATMISGVPSSLNYTNTLTRFNQVLPAQYWIATKSAFGTGVGTGPPGFYATTYQSDTSNTVDHLLIDATGGSPVYDSVSNRYLTDFVDMRARINSTVLWEKKGAVMTYLGGSAPTRTTLVTGRADIDLIDTYSTGDFFRVRNTFSSPDGKILSLADLPADGTPEGFLRGQNVRTTIRSNLLSKGSLDIFGSVEGRALSGSLHLDNADVLNILQGRSGSLITAPLGLVPG